MICNVPSGQTLSLWAEAGEEARAAERAIEVKPRTIRKEDLILGLTNQTEPGDILGRVRERRNGDPVVGAEVRLQGTDFRTITNERGTFTFEEVPWGIYVLEVDHIAFARAEQAFRVQGGRAHQVEVLMTEEAIELDPITVTVRPRSWFSGMSGLQHRINVGFGYVLEREDLERRGASNIGDALRGIPGVRVVSLGAYGSTVVFRNSRNLLSQSCTPTVWMDGVRITLDPQLGLNEFTALDLEAIEVYRSTAEVPGEFGGYSNCGVLVLWTRRGIGR
jgi:CarboxypepD_reg-like domain/TonB-dependent Receptor Plug Domain